jgi:Tol biopolymer transport system component
VTETLPPSDELKTVVAPGRLDSWKAIASYLRRDVSTVQRWERREGMPVHRHLHAKQGSVYAYRSELDEWCERRRAAAVLDEPVSIEATGKPDTVQRPASQAGRRGLDRLWIPLAIGALLLGAGWGGYSILRDHAVDHDPFLDAKTTELTDEFGAAQAAVISRDGRQVAFLATLDGHTDAYLSELGSGQYRNLTQGRVTELSNPSVRTLGFSPDGSLVTVWSRTSDGSRPGDVNVLSVPPQGGALQTYLPGAAEVAWSSDGRRIAYHTTAPGDPIFVKDLDRPNAREIYVAPAGVHCHFPLWSADDAFIYFVRGVPPDDWDLWRIRPAGDGLERMTHHEALVSHPVLLDRHTLGYLASDSQHSGPWLFSLHDERRIPHRIGLGLEHYTSLAASLDGTRLVATASKARSSLSRLSIDAAAQHEEPIVSFGTTPRLGLNYLLYISSSGGQQSIFKWAKGHSEQLWSATEPSGVVGGLSIASDDRRVAFTVTEGKKTTLWVMNSDGGQVRTVTATLPLRGGVAWTPDGKAIVAAVVQQGEPRLMTIPLDGSQPRPLVAEYSLDPSWSPNGQILLYSGPDVGTTFAVRAVAADGRPYPFPPLILSRGARRVAFWRDGQSVVVLRGDLGRKSLWLIDLQSGTQHPLADLKSEPAIGDFDVSRAGDQIVLERIQESSEVILIERSRPTGRN